MKRCPECRRDYYDDTLLYCLDDGNALLEGPASGASSDEPMTAILHDTAGVNEAATRAQVFTTDQTAVLPSGITEIPKAKSFDKRLLLAPVALALIVLGGFLAYQYFSASSSKQINSIAVMPFDNRNSDADTDYLSDGLAESVIFRLTQIPDLRVSPTSSVMRYKGSSTDVAKIASELDVDAVMTGRLTKRGDNLNITVELVDARTNKSLWGEQYERKLSELLTTQREIVAEIVGKLQLKLSGESEQKLAKKYTDNNDAYRDYLQGRFYWNKRTPDTISKAVEHLERAVQKDPNFALAYAGLADAQMITHYLSRKWSDDYLIAKAQANAERAIQLDATLAEPHATLGLIKSYQWEWDGSEKEFLRAVELNPKYATTYHWYSRLLRTEGRYPEALAQIKKGQEADPLSQPIAENVIQNLVENGDLDGALEQSNRSLELDPNYWSIYFRRAAVYFEKGKNDEGFAAASKSIGLIGHAPIAMGFWGYALAKAGKRDEALAVAKELEQMYAAKEMDGVRIASVYVGLGDKDKAFEWLERDFQARRPTLMEMCLELEFRSLRDDPRFKDLLKRMGLPE